MLVLVATVMGRGRHERLVQAAVAAVFVGFLGGMTIAVVTSNPLF